jgi:hypothetical protein
MLTSCDSRNTRWLLLGVAPRLIHLKTVAGFK